MGHVKAPIEMPIRPSISCGAVHRENFGTQRQGTWIEASRHMAAGWPFG